MVDLSFLEKFGDLNISISIDNKKTLLKGVSFESNLILSDSIFVKRLSLDECYSSYDLLDLIRTSKIHSIQACFKNKIYNISHVYSLNDEIVFSNRAPIDFIESFDMKGI